MVTMQRRVCALRKLVLHSRGIWTFPNCTGMPGGRVYLGVAHRLGFFCPDNKKAPVWGLEQCKGGEATNRTAL